MKDNTRKTRRRSRFALAALAVVILALMLSVPAMAANNIATGDIAGDSGALNSSNVFSLFTTTLSLNKMAFLSNGTQLTSGATLPRGTEVRFVIYIDNTTAFGMSDVSIQDVLDPTFSYQTGTMQVDNSAATGATPTQIYNAVNGGLSVTDDPLDGDVASAVGVTIDVGRSVVGTNGQLNIGPNSVWAILFRALMQ
jgi:uncharacterized repeat protein (TIGR01451 family)